MNPVWWIENLLVFILFDANHLENWGKKYLVYVLLIWPANYSDSHARAAYHSFIPLVR